MAVPNLTRQDADARAGLLDLSSYDIDVDLTDGGGKPGDRTFRSRSTIRFGCRQPGAETFVDLVAAEVREVTLNGTPVDTADYAPERGIRLPDLAADNVLVVDADCLYTNSGEGLHRFVDPVDGHVYLYSQFETSDAKRVYACFDQPDLKATFTWHVVAPYDWEVMSNGRAVGVDDAPGGAKLVHFATTPRLSTYVTALVAGPYHKVLDSHDGIDLGVYCRGSLHQHLDADQILLVTKQGFDYFHHAFDYRYPFDKYDQLFVPEFNAGAMENAGCVTLLEDYVFRSRMTDAAYERRAETILHEMAHMWFGDLVTMRWWDDLWLNESFASFAAVLCQAQATRWTTAWTTFANVEKTWAYKQDQLPSTHPVASDIPDVQAVEVNFDGITYAKGASVLKQLAAYVGIEAFLRGLRAYFRRHEYGNTTLADLLRALQEASGRDLSRWSAQWLETAGINTIEPDFTLDDDGRYTSFALVQTAPPAHPTLRDHRLAIGLYALDGEKLIRVDRIELDVSGARTEVPSLVGVTQPDLLLVNDDDLTYSKIRLDERSLRTVTARLADLSDSLPRALCWTAAWEMTRAGEMAARDYVRLVLTGIHREPEISVLLSLQRQALTALSHYVDPAWAPEGWRWFATVALDALRAAAPGSDQQLAWARALANSARSADHLDVLRRVLDGTEVIEGLKVDADLRWALLQSLVAMGVAGAAEIDAERERDATASGQRRAATARALLPTAAGKAEAWRLVTEDDDLPNATTEAIIIGFTHPAQEPLLVPYVERYFADVGKVWARRTGKPAQNVTVGLFPHQVITQSTVDAADAFLAAPDVPPPLRRLVGEGRAETVRALRARARDALAAR